MGYRKTIFIGDPIAGSCLVRAQIFTTALELLVAGHPSIGAAWWLRDTAVELFAAWTPEFALHEPNSPQGVGAADPEGHSGDFPHCLWTWIDKSTGHIPSEASAPEPGMQEDEATGPAAMGRR